MKVIRTLPVSPPPRHPVLTIGNFDGQHIGHCALVKTVVEVARRTKGTPMALTFKPHPAVVLNPGADLCFLSTEDEKLRFFESHGIQALVVLEFTRALADLTPEQFVFKVLRDGIGVRELLVGENFVFGKGRSGNVPMLTTLGAQADFVVHPIPPVRLDGHVVSSTRIREAIQSGNLHDAARCLGRPYRLNGIVVQGSGRGAELGWPTANVRIPGHRVIPPDGVYATSVLWKGATFPSVAYIGTRPTFVEGERMLEVHLFDVHPRLYGEELGVSFIERLRGDIKFPSVPELLRQMEHDAAQARQVFQVLKEAQGERS